MFQQIATATVLGCFSFGCGTVPAVAAGPQCGDKITADYVLTQDLDCTGTALFVAASRDQSIRVDLNGHRLKGAGKGVGVDTEKFSPYGTNTRAVTVANGTVTGFASAFVGLNVNRAALNNLLVTNMQIVGNGTWLPQRVVGEARIEDSTVIDSGTGGAYTDTAHLTVENARFVRSGILSLSESVNLIEDSTFVNGGFASYHLSTLTAQRNTFTDCDTGILMGDVWNTPTSIEGNTFRNCGIGVGLYGLTGPVSVHQNTFTGNKNAGMVYHQPRKGLEVAQNSFIGNRGDGLTGTGAGPVRVTGNLAVGNAGLGINVPSDSVGEGNTARRNGNPRQCAGVVCDDR